ncbi:MAG: hypothetical protein C4555_01245 [Dehalococcoidia bacterium]|jgi:hypothetical protein|nr:MAG: hypothetical protein C4555_01245 [Dehalococcoidia bacterium]
MKRHALFRIALLINLLNATAAFASVPRLINYQGVLTDAVGVVLEGAHDLAFSIYEDSTATTAAWTEVHSAVPLSKGVFSVILGGLTPITDEVFAGSSRWLGIGVDSSQETAPRMRLTSVPWAIRSAVADSARVAASGGGGESLWESDGQNVYRSLGRIGLGTANPVSSLHISNSNPDVTLDMTSASTDLGPEIVLSRGGLTQARVYWARTDSAVHITNPIRDGIIIKGNRLGINVSKPRAVLHLRDATSTAWLGDPTGLLVRPYRLSGRYDQYIPFGSYSVLDVSDSSSVAQRAIMGTSLKGTGGYFSGSQGVRAGGSDYGVYASSYKLNGSSNNPIGVYANVGAEPSVTSGSKYGLRGYVSGGASTNYAVYGYATGATTNYAGYFSGNVRVTGTLTKGAGAFEIDHPLDPANMYLRHSFVESPEMLNVYSGTCVLDANGKAVVELPKYFEALNRSYRYQLTCVGSYAPVFIAQEISGNTFTIAGGIIGTTVCWQVTGVRKDAYAQAHPIIVEENKSNDQVHKYLHPQLYNKSAENGVDSNDDN